MAGYINESKNNIAKQYANNGFTDKAKQILENELYSPIFNYLGIHPEEEPVLNDVNNIVSDISNDIDIIESEIITCANNISTLMKNTALRIDNINKQISKEDERLQDLNMLCGKNSNFELSVALSKDDFQGDFNFEDGVFTPEITGSVETKTSVVSVSGNGYEGNDYIFNGRDFMKKTFDTSIRNNMTDANLETYYEYSRINAVKENIVFPLVNFDNLDVKCYVTLEAEDFITKIKVLSNLTGIYISEIFTSKDGSVFEKVLDGQFYINEKSYNYKQHDYINGSGIICFPKTKYVRIGFVGKDSLNETVAFELTKIM